MVKKLQEEWEKLSQEARQAAEQDPSRMKEIVERMNVVAGAIQKMSQASVTRTTLSQAVRDSLREILKGEPVLPEVAALREELSAVRSEVQEKLAAAQAAAAGAGEGLKGAVERGIATIGAKLGGEIRALEDRFHGEVAALKDFLEDRIQGAESRVEARLELRLAKREEPGAGLVDLKGEVQRRVDDLAAEIRARAESMGAELSSRLEQLAGDLPRTAGELAARVEDQSARLAALDQDLASADDHLAEGLKDLESRLTERVSALESDSASRIEAMKGNLLHNLAAAETRLCESQGQLETRFSGEMQEIAVRMMEGLSGRVSRIEEALPEIRAMEERLQARMDTAMDQITDKVNSLVDMVGQIQTSLPSRELLAGMDDRLGRLETRIRTVTDQLEGLEGAVPELRSLGERIASLKEEVAALMGEVSSFQKDHRGSLDLFLRRVQDIQDLLRALVERWNADRSNLRQRLVDLRDTLRDQLQAAIQTSDGLQSTFWGKLLAKPEGGLRFGAEEWERFRARLETIVQGLESLLSEVK